MHFVKTFLACDLENVTLTCQMAVGSGQLMADFSHVTRINH